MALDLAPLGETQPRPRARWLAPLSVMLGSLMVLIPIVSVVPFLPPCGLMMLLAWRLLRGDAIAVWAAVPLGLFDDLVSGQPLGSAMMLWAACFVMIDVIETRLVWRDFWQNWLIATGGMAFALIAGRFLTTPFGANVDTAMLLQIAVSAALFPMASRLAAWLDRDVRKP